MGKLAVKSEVEQQSMKKTGAVKFCCQGHVIQVLKVVYLPHIVKVKSEGNSCSFCEQKARYQLL